jgi:hypothetical protein
VSLFREAPFLCTVCGSNILAMRPLHVLTGVAACLVTWFSVRMWCGSMYDVWRGSVLLGAWSPLLAASLYLYVREIGEREHTVFAAWIARAIGMHCVLAWLIGVFDVVHGPPGTRGSLIADVIAPFALVAFVPVFGLCATVLRWAQSVSTRLPEPTRAKQRETVSVTVPYRGVLPGTLVDEQLPVQTWLTTFTGVAFLVTGVVSTTVATTTVLSSLGLGLMSALGRRVVLPSAAILACVAGSVSMNATQSLYGAACVAPWVLLAGLATYLTTAELRLRWVTSQQPHAV